MYTLDLEIGAEAVLISPTATDSNATITVNGDPVATGTASSVKPLNLGDNTFTVEVTGPNCQSQSYILEVTRASHLTQRAYIKASNTDADDFFGGSVSLYGDTLAVSAPSEDSSATGIDGDQGDNSAEDGGAVYVFRWTGSVWAQEAYIKASNTHENGFFGASLSLYEDTLAVGDETGLSGAVYVFRRTGSIWTQEAHINESEDIGLSNFGGSVSLYEDVLAIGASHDDSGSTGINGDPGNYLAMDSGAVYVFHRTGSIWTQEAYVKPSNTYFENYFGGVVSLHGNILAVGATGESSSATGIDGEQHDYSAINSGAVYVFRRTDDTWTQEAYIKASNPDENDTFGNGVSLYEDTLAVSAYGEDSNATGINGDQLDNSVERSGAVYMFRRTDNTWTQEAYVKASNPNENDTFGGGMSLFE
ncbi:MAG: integrin, partial [Deltaproteobacteria bacterium]|nr:integrin [Deltaproteobacteria bacterium]